MPKARILVVEDEVVVSDYIQSSLGRLGYTICALACSGEEAMQKACTTAPDLVLMDIRLKGSTNGVEVAQQIHNRLSIPVVYLTAYIDDEILRKAKITEPYGYLIKPFKERELHATVAMALYKYNADNELQKREQWLSAVLRSIGDAVIATGKDNCIALINPIAESLTEWSAAEALGKPLGQVLRIRNEEVHSQTPKGSLRSAILISKTGRETPIEESYTPILDFSGYSTGTVWVFRDISQRKKREDDLRQSEEELRRHRNHLEEMVQARTSYLIEIKEQLEQEIAERVCAEEKITASLHEKELLLKEIHHRVKNNLQIISTLLHLQCDYIHDPDCLVVFNESQNRIQSMATVHELLYQSDDLGRIDLAEYIEKLVLDLFCSYGADPDLISWKIDVQNVDLDLDTAIPCGLIITELVSNSLKYAFPGKRAGQISVCLHQTRENEFTLIVSDNGIGCPDNIDLKTAKSLGWKLVATLTAQIDGTIELEHAEGTSFRIVFKESEKTRKGKSATRPIFSHSLSG